MRTRGLWYMSQREGIDITYIDKAGPNNQHDGGEKNICRSIRKLVISSLSAPQLNKYFALLHKELLQRLLRVK
jgi:hypothetical protein